MFKENATTTEDYWIEQHEYLDVMRDELDKREAQPKTLCWISDEETGDDSDEDYCYECADEFVKKNGGEIFSSVWHESDGVRVCEECGCLLAYTLTDYGVKSEIEHFLEASWDWNNPTHCFEVNRILGGVIGSGWFDVEKIGFERMTELLMLLHTGKNTPNINL